MWIFLVTEIMFFGGLFLCYIVYRTTHPAAVVAASHELDITLGGINTAVLIGSSLTMVLAVRAAEAGLRKRLVGCVILTILLGAVRLGTRGVEYQVEFVNRHV